MFKSTQESGDAILTSHGSSESSSELMSKEFGVLLASDVDAYVTILLNWSKYNTLISPRTTNSFNFRALVLFKFKSLRNNGSFAPLHIHNHTVIKGYSSWNSKNQLAPKLSELWWTVELADQGSFVTAVTLSISSSSIQGLSSVVVATPMITLLF